MATVQIAQATRPSNCFILLKCKMTQVDCVRARLCVCLHEYGFKKNNKELTSREINDAAPTSGIKQSIK